MRLVDKTRLLPHGRHGRIVGMGGEPYARLLGHGNDFFQKALQAAPEFCVRNRGKITGEWRTVVDHVPDHPIWNGHVFGGTVHAQRDRMPPPERSSHATANTCQTKVVTEHRNASLAEA